MIYKGTCLRAPRSPDSHDSPSCGNKEHMALSPAEITRKLHVARDLDARRQSTQAFILAWIAWEAFNFRLLLCAVQMQGLTQARAQDVLSRLRAHDSRTVKQIRRELFVE